MNKTHFLLLALFFFTAIASAQIKKAENLMMLFNYSEAGKILQKVVEENDPETMDKASLLLAECYRKQNAYLPAGAWYARVIASGNATPETYFYYGQMLRATGDYDRAKNIFLKYDSVSGNSNGKLFASYCDSAIRWKSARPAYTVTNAAALNSGVADFSPVFYEKGIVFTSDRNVPEKKGGTYGWTGNSYLHLMAAGPAGDTAFESFGSPVTAPGLFSNEYHDGPASFSRNNDEIFFNRTFVKNDEGRNDNHIRTHLLKIYSSVKKEGTWGKPVPFFLNSDLYSVGHPALSPDGNILCFVSDMPGGAGGTDIFYCRRENGKWSDAVNAGPAINTSFNEMFPFIADNGDLYFASEGLPGMGGLDIFLAKYRDGKWQDPVNPGCDINSSCDDFGLCISPDGTRGLLSSNRPGGLGSDDIYYFRKAEIQPVRPTVAFVSGCVKDKTTNQAIPFAHVFLIENHGTVVKVIVTDGGGCFKTPVNKGSAYTVKAMEVNYISDCLNFSVDASEPSGDLSLPRYLLLDKLAVDRRFTIENIYYDFDRFNIRKDAEAPLDDLVKIMKENQITVELGSHTDSRGSDEYNLVLSQNRADAAVSYIISRGIAPGRITAKGYGETMLINRCKNDVPCTREEHQANRRTEFKVTTAMTTTREDVFDLNRFRDGENVEKRLLPENFFEKCQ